MYNQTLDILKKNKGIIFLFLVFMLMVGSTAAWLYLGNDFPKKTPLRAKQVFLLFDPVSVDKHNNINNVQTITADKLNFK